MKYITGVMITAAMVGLAACDSSSTQDRARVDHKVAVQAPAGEVVMYKSPTCGCCGNWAEHLRRAGFTVIEKKREDMEAIKAKYGVPGRLASCHTALIDGYVIEGHVPADDIRRLLRDRPAVAGLTAPGMPMKSPGMQAAGLPPRGYDVLAFDKDGSHRVFSRY